MNYCPLYALRNVLASAFTAPFQSLGYRRGDFPEAERAAEEVLSPPIYPELREGDIKLMVKALKDAIKEGRGACRPLP